MTNFFIRNARARHFIEYFCIAAVITIFFIRIFLYLTGYPHIGGDHFHIAHMLWGGLLMAVSIILMLSFLNREIKTMGAIVGGIGFGTFIDELGKFLTHDNNYFFQPTILLIYLIFVGLFFLAKYIEIWFPLDDCEYLVNSLELLKEVALKDLDAKEKALALMYLKKASTNEDLYEILRKTFNEIEPLPPRRPPLLIQFTQWLDGKYKYLVANPLFGKIIIVVFFLTSIDNFALLFFPDISINTFVEAGVFISTLLSLYFVFQGAYFFGKNKRQAAYESLKIATLVSILLVQLFLFYIEQLSAAVELFGAIVSLQVLQFGIDKEKSLRAERAEEASLPTPSHSQG